MFDFVLEVIRWLLGLGVGMLLLYVAFRLLWVAFFRSLREFCSSTFTVDKEEE